jgi:hypothetical protein
MLKKTIVSLCAVAVFVVALTAGVISDVQGAVPCDYKPIDYVKINHEEGTDYWILCQDETEAGLFPYILCLLNRDGTGESFNMLYFVPWEGEITPYPYATWRHIPPGYWITAPFGNSIEILTTHPGGVWRLIRLTPIDRNGEVTAYLTAGYRLD